MLVTTYFLGLLVVASATIDKAFIVELAPSSSLFGRSVGLHKAFYKRAEHLDYTVRHEFNSPDTYLGLSLEVRSSGTNEEIRAQLKAIQGVRSVSQVQRVTLPVTFNTSVDPFLSFSKPPPLKPVTGRGNLGSALQMGGVDKLHALGIKGKGIKIGIIDTGVDYRHPALGAGFGPGFKIAGGYSFVADNGTTISNPDPLTTCYGGGHGTHVAGLIGMNSVPGSFDIEGVAPEATLYAYKALDCNGHGGSDNTIAAMLKAQEDGVNIVSMSIGLGAQSFHGDIDPLADVTKKLTDAGIAVIVAMANNVQRGRGGGNLYLEQWPSTEPSAIGVGAIANKDFPLVYSTVDSKGSTIKYASVWPIDLPNGADVFMLDDGCNSNSWNTALATVTNVNNTIFAFNVGDGTTEGQYCQLTSITGWNGASQKPVYIMAYNSPTNEPFFKVYDTPSQGFFGTVQFTNVNSDDGAVLAANYAAAGGYGKYKLTFANKNFESPPQFTGGNMDYYSNYGPVWHTYDLKPQISAPGGHTLSTWPLGTLGGYVILSGTSMATPYVSASFALIKTQFPKATNQQILNLIQTNASPLPWIYDTSILAATAQQGAGQINVYNAIFSKSTVSPGQIKVSDVTRTEYGTANITISNPSTKLKTYTLSHQGAGYTDFYLQYREDSQVPIYGNATFKAPRVTIPADRLPVFGGFVKIASTDGESFSVPYLGAPYSLYNTPYLFISTSGTILPQLYVYNETTGTLNIDSGFLEVDPAQSYGYSFPTSQWTTEMRIDILPANTAIKANNYGFDTATVIPTYQASSVTPTSNRFGFPSYGTILRQEADTWNWPTGNSNSKVDTVVTADDGSKVTIGNGDVRFFASVLRAGGTSGVQADYDTYLGPVVRFINS